MTKKRPILDWLHELPDGYRERAIAAHDGDSRLVSSMRQAIAQMVAWSRTAEGSLF